MSPNRNLSYPEFRASHFEPKKDEYGGTIGARSFDEWKATENVPAPGHEVTINMDQRRAESAAIDGRIKNLFELPTNERTRSGSYQEIRRGAEKSIFGLPLNAAGKRRPVYGHVRQTNDHESPGNMYGGVALDLWPGKNHITTTDGDSLDRLVESHGYGELSYGVPKAEAWRSTQFDDLQTSHGDDARTGDYGGDYREAQIHGGVPVAPTHVKRAQIQTGRYLQEDPFVTQALRARGIPTTVVGNWEQPSMFTNEDVKTTLPSGRKVLLPENNAMTRSQHFMAGLPREWENNKAPAWAYGVERS